MLTNAKDGIPLENKAGSSEGEVCMYIGVCVAIAGKTVVAFPDMMMVVINQNLIQCFDSCDFNLIKTRFTCDLNGGIEIERCNKTCLEA